MAGAMPESAYSGIMEGESIHDHSEMESALKGLLDGLMGSKRLSPKWKGAFAAVLDSYMGQVPEYNEKSPSGLRPSGLFSLYSGNRLNGEE